MAKACYLSFQPDQTLDPFLPVMQGAFSAVDFEATCSDENAGTYSLQIDTSALQCFQELENERVNSISCKRTWRSD